MPGGRRCVAANCSAEGAKSTVHSFPKDSKLRQKWVKFVGLKRKGFTAATAFMGLCKLHFTEDSYENLSQYKAGFATRLVLKKCASPTIHLEECNVESVDEGSTSSSVHEDHSYYSSLKSCSPSPPKKRRAADKLEAARLVRSYLPPPPPEPEPISCHVEVDEGEFDIPHDSSIRQSIGTQFNTPGKDKCIQYSFREITMDFSCQWPDPDDPAPDFPSPIKHIGLPDPVRTSSPMTSDDESWHEEDNDISYLPCEDSFREFQEEMTFSDENTEEEPWFPDSSSHRHSAVKVKKYIVFEDELFNLMNICQVCGVNKCQKKVVKTLGTYIEVKIVCTECSFNTMWSNMPKIGRMPAGNLLLSTAILSAGAMPTQTVRVLKTMNLQVFSMTTYFKHQTDYVIPSVIKLWRERQHILMETLAGLYDGNIILAGDSRCDSPGHCAKYGTYTHIEQQCNKVIDIQLIQSNTVQNSFWMELEGFKKSVDFLTDQGTLTITQVITDRHVQIKKEVKENMPMTTHYYDVWHMAKKIRKKIDEVAKKRGCEVAGRWKNSIVTHLYWCAATSNGNGEMVKQKWLSIENHIRDIHDHGEGSPLFPNCHHGDIEAREYLEPGTQAYESICDIISSPRFLADVPMMSPKYQTSSLEAFHSLMLKFAPKHTGFSYLGMYTRNLIAGLHYNENSERLQAVTKDGRPRFSLCFPRAKKGGYTVRGVKTTATYEYAFDILDTTMRSYQESPRQLKQSIDDLRHLVPQSLASGKERPTLEDAIDERNTRFNL